MLWVEDQEIEAFNAILDADLRRIEELHYSSGLPTDCILFAVVTKRINLIKLLLEWGYCWDEDSKVYLRSYSKEERASVINVLSFYEIQQDGF